MGSLKENSITKSKSSKSKEKKLVSSVSAFYYEFISVPIFVGIAPNCHHVINVSLILTFCRLEIPVEKHQEVPHIGTGIARRFGLRKNLKSIQEGLVLQWNRGWAWRVGNDHPAPGRPQTRHYEVSDRRRHCHQGPDQGARLLSAEILLRMTLQISISPWP